MANPANFQKRNAQRQAAERIDLERVKLMAECGHPGCAIAKALGRTPQAIRSFCCRNGIKLRPARKPKHGSRFKLPDDLFDSFRLAAAERGMSPTQLAALILRTVLTDNLFAAILDVPVKPVQALAPAVRDRETSNPMPSTTYDSPTRQPAFQVVLAGPQPQLVGRM
jgi:hypothetical protein